MHRNLTPGLNAPGLTTAGMAVYAAAVMTWNAVHHHGVIQSPVIVAAVGAVAALLTRQAVTPVRDPRDGNGLPLQSPAAVAALVAAAAASPHPQLRRPWTAPPAAETLQPAPPEAAAEATPDTGGM